MLVYDSQWLAYDLLIVMYKIHKAPIIDLL